MSFSLDFSTIPDGDHDATLQLEIRPASSGVQNLLATYLIHLPDGELQAINSWPMPLDASRKNPKYAETRQGKTYVRGLFRLTGLDPIGLQKSSDIVELFDGIVLRVRVMNATDPEGFRIPRVEKILYVVRDTDGEPFIHPDPEFEGKVKAKAKASTTNKPE